jgi:ATP-dependent Clp protease ATP-binding subunit ClpA
VVVKFVDELKRSLVERRINLMLTESMIEHLVSVGYDPKMGARPLSRKIDELIKVPLSKKILFEQLKDCAVTVDWNNDAVIFSHDTAAPVVDKDGIIVID